MNHRPCFIAQHSGRDQPRTAVGPLRGTATKYAKAGTTWSRDRSASGRFADE